MNILKSTITYLKNFIKDKDVASVTPSSKLLIKRVCSHLNFEEDKVIVEYGAGTGVFSKYLLDQMTPGSELILFETNPEFYKKLQDICDDRIQVYNDSVEHVTKLLKGRYRNKIGCAFLIFG